MEVGFSLAIGNSCITAKKGRYGYSGTIFRTFKIPNQ